MSLIHPFPTATKNAQALRKRLTEAEKFLWNVLRGRKFLGYKFRRQAPVGRFIADFLCIHPPLILEVDGLIHNQQEAYDAERTESIVADYQIPVLRLANHEVMETLPSALKKIEAALIESQKQSVTKLKII